MNEVAIIGVGMHKFGHFADKSAEDMAEIALRRALEDAGVHWKQVEYLAMSRWYDIASCSNLMLKRLGHTGIPTLNCDAACAGGYIAMWHACQAIKAGTVDLAVILGTEKSPRGMLPMPGYGKWRAEMGWAMPAIKGALMLNAYMDRYGITKTHLAKVSVKNHRNAALNPYAHLPMPNLTVEEVLKDEVIVEPLTRLMIGPASEGAGAVVVCNAKHVKKYTTRKPVYVAGSVSATAPFTDISGEPGLARALAVRKVYELAGMGPKDIDFACVHDAEAGFELMCYQEAGFCAEGESGRMIDEGRTEISGDIPVNPHGGFMGGGNAPGAVAFASMAEATWQLRGEAGARQVKDGKPKTGLCFHSGANDPSSVGAVILKV